MRHAAALLAGLSLFASDHPLHWWPLQLVSFVPFWWALMAARAARLATWQLGAAFALGYTLPLLIAVGVNPPILVVAIASIGQWTVLAVVAGRLLDLGPVRGALGAAAAVTLLEVGIWYGVPMFGTAQCFARPLSAAPSLVGFVAFTGIAGLVFVLAAVQALLAAALRTPRSAAPVLLALSIVALAAGLDAWRWTRALGAPVRVAAYGWNQDPFEENVRFLDGCDATFGEAAAAGARLVVTPETGAHVGTGRRAAALEAFGGLARKHGLTAVIGVWHAPTDDNRIWFFDGTGALRGEYLKTHLVPWLEDYAAGDGTIVTTQVGSVALGGMICQDDNFTDLARAYGRMSIPLLAVPTNDWPAIRAFHLENTVFRAIDNGYAIVRAASGGISALVSPRGEVLARCDHVTDGPRLLLGEVPTGDGVATVYARFGDWPMVGLCLALLAAALRHARRRD